MDKKFTTLSLALLAAMDYYAQQTCFRVKREDQPYQDISYAEFRTLTFRLAHFFLAAGVKPGDRIAIVAANSPEWMMAYAACLLLGGTAVPLRPTLPDEMLRSIIQDSGACVVLADGEHQEHLINAVVREHPQLKLMLTFSDHRPSHPVAAPIFSVLRDPITAEQVDLIRSAAEQVEPEAIASIHYTASETGMPKGAVFTHVQRLQTMRHIAEWLILNDDDLVFTVLPWTSTSSLDISIRCFLSGIANALARSGRFVLESLQETSPTLTFVTPFGVELFYREIMREMEELPEASQEVFNWAISLSKAHRAAGAAASDSLRAEYARADRTFFSQIRGKVGGRLERSYVVGASLPPRLHEFVEAIGIMPLSLYTLTEAGGFPAVSRPGAQRVDACGQVAPGFQIRIAEDGEVLVKSPTVIHTYWNQPEAIQQVIDANGWLRTGDLGRIDDSGYLYLTGRKEAIMVLSSGRKIIPRRIENALKSSPLISQAVVFADGQPYVTALIVPDLEALADVFEDSAGVDDRANSPAIQWIWLGDDKDQEPFVTTAHPQVKARIDRIVAGVNQKLDLWERIERYVLLEQAFSSAANELTDLTRSRRRQIAERYAAQIESMYPKRLRLSSERITHVLVTPERMRQLLEKETILDAWMTDTGLEFLFEIAQRLRIDAPSIVHICDTAASIAQMEHEARPLSTALMVGDPARIARYLPPSQVQLRGHDHIRRMRKQLVTLATIVDGMVLGYVIDKHGYVRGIHKLNPVLDEQLTNALLGPQFRRHAALSGHCDALVFFVPSGGKQVRVFAEGRLVGRYSSGDWSPDMIPQIEGVVAQLSQQKKYDLHLIQRVLRCAFRMSEENYGAIFIIGNVDEVLERSDAPEINPFAWIVDSHMAMLSDQELITFARQDGATLIDLQGRFRGCMVLLRPLSNTRVELQPGRGARHSSAAKISAEARCLAITVSQDGPISIYDNGRRVVSL